MPLFVLSILLLELVDDPRWLMPDGIINELIDPIIELVLQRACSVLDQDVNNVLEQLSPQRFVMILREVLEVLLKMIRGLLLLEAKGRGAVACVLQAAISNDTRGCSEAVTSSTSMPFISSSASSSTSVLDPIA